MATACSLVTALKDCYHCVTYDFFGQRQSQVTDGGYNLDTLIEDMVRQEEVTGWQGHLLANDRVSVTQTVEAVITRQGVADQLYQIRLLILIISGAEDVTTAPEKSEKLKAGIDGAQVVSIPTCGHMIRPRLTKP